MENGSICHDTSCSICRAASTGSSGPRGAVEGWAGRSGHEQHSTPRIDVLMRALVNSCPANHACVSRYSTVTHGLWTVENEGPFFNLRPYTRRTLEPKGGNNRIYGRIFLSSQDRRNHGAVSGTQGDQIFDFAWLSPRSHAVARLPTPGEAGPGDPALPSRTPSLAATHPFLPPSGVPRHR